MGIALATFRLAEVIKVRIIIEIIDFPDFPNSGTSEKYMSLIAHYCDDENKMVNLTKACDFYV